MQRHKSKRHQWAANARWRAREWKAEAERAVGIPDVPLPVDCRAPFDLPLRCVGYRDLHIEPRLGYVAWRAVDTATGEVVHCAALKELLRLIARDVPKMLAARNFDGT